MQSCQDSDQESTDEESKGNCHIKEEPKETTSLGWDPRTEGAQVKAEKNLSYRLQLIII